MKNFDDIFRRKVKEAFDNYNADHLAEEGWNSYVRKHGGKRIRAIVIPFWARAASIAVLVTVGVLFTARINHRKAGEPVNQIAVETRSELTESAKKEDTAAASPVIADSGAVIEAAAGKTPVRANPDQASGTTVSKAGQIRQTGTEKPGYQVSQPAGPVLADGSLLSDTSMAARSVLSETKLAAAMSDGMKLPDNPMKIRLTYAADTQLKLTSKEEPEDFPVLPREKMTTTIMGGLSGMMASIDNTTSISQGVSIGFYVEQQLTRRISVRPGLAMAKHNYAMENMSGGSTTMDYAAPELNGMSGTTTSFEADMEVVSLEVPVNFVFSIWKRARSNLFVSTGASTVVYLSQHMSGNYNNTYIRTTVDSYGKVSYDSMTTSVRIESEQEPLNRADFLGLANFSAGYSIPFGKTSHLLFEPFVQLPVKDLTSLNLRIRYGGLSIKIKF